jgi:hypothetical protein
MGIARTAVAECRGGASVDQGGIYDPAIVGGIDMSQSLTGTALTVSTTAGSATLTATSGLTNNMIGNSIVLLHGSYGYTIYIIIAVASGTSATLDRVATNTSTGVSAIVGGAAGDFTRICWGIAQANNTGRWGGKMWVKGSPSLLYPALVDATLNPDQLYCICLSSDAAGYQGILEGYTTTRGDGTIGCATISPGVADPYGVRSRFWRNVNGALAPVTRFLRFLYNPAVPYMWSGSGGGASHYFDRCSFDVISGIGSVGNCQLYSCSVVNHTVANFGWHSRNIFRLLVNSVAILASSNSEIDNVYVGNTGCVITGGGLVSAIIKGCVFYNFPNGFMVGSQNANVVIENCIFHSVTNLADVGSLSLETKLAFRNCYAFNCTNLPASGVTVLVSDPFLNAAGSDFRLTTAATGIIGNLSIANGDAAYPSYDFAGAFGPQVTPGGGGAPMIGSRIGKAA